MRFMTMRLRGAPILVYHKLAPDVAQASRWTLPSRAFAEHLDFLARAGRSVVSLADFWALGETRPTGTRPPVVVTFDDGAVSDYDLAFPLLRERSLPAEFFINPATVGQPGYLSWSQVNEMARSGMGIQSHGYDHVQLTRQPDGVVRDQLRRSKEEIEAQLGKPVAFFALPYGLGSRRVIELALGEGYRAVCTSWNWPARPGRRTLGRVAIYGDTDTARLARLVGGRPMAFAGRALRAAALYVPRQLLLTLRPERLGVSVLHPR